MTSIWLYDFKLNHDLSQHCSATRLCRELGRVLNDRQFAQLPQMSPRKKLRTSYLSKDQKVELVVRLFSDLPHRHCHNVSINGSLYSQSTQNQFDNWIIKWGVMKFTIVLAIADTIRRHASTTNRGPVAGPTNIAVNQFIASGWRENAPKLADFVCLN